MASFTQYFLLCFGLSGGSAVCAVALWSDLGCGLACIELAQSRTEMAAISLGFIALALLALYLFDFFAPPHLPGRYLRCCEGQDVAGQSSCLVIGTACFVACIFSAKIIPSMPLLATTFLSPVCVIIVHQALVSEETVENLPLEQLATLAFEERIAMLTEVTQIERQQRDFCAAAMCALALTGLSCLCGWVPWAMSNQLHHAGGTEDRALLFVLWVAPLVVGLSNIIFAIFVSLRVALNSRYKMTHSLKNRLIVANVQHATCEEIERHRDVLLKARNSFAKGMTVTMSPVKVEKYLTQHLACMWVLSAIMKAIGCAFIVMIGTIFVTFELVTAVGPTTSLMVQSFTSAFFLTFASFVAVCFGRLWQAMNDWLVDLPLWRFLLAVTRAAWARAAFACVLLPLTPGLLALSALNQRVRVWRGLHKLAEMQGLAGPLPGSSRKKPRQESETLTAPPRPILTYRVRAFLRELREWDWVPIIWWWYIIAWILIILKLTPLFLNVLLAWMKCAMGGLNFGLILAATFALGMVLFMLPPVPGPPIYLFGGVVISDKCPLGFWWGAVICVVLSFVLKLTACAVQQKLIGEHLGGSLRVRRAAGVHKPLIRAIELVLRKPGLSIEKCAILCGGPDWPTSVLAGILKLSLGQCLLGTIPVLASVVPLCLTGSFYLRRDEGQLWVRAGNLMFSLTILISIGFWAAMGWAIQDVYEKRQEEIHKPREDFLELEWQDYREDYITRKTRPTWADIPTVLRVPFLGGALCMTAVCHIVMWRSALCFGTFKVTGDVSTLSWFGAHGLVKPVGIAALATVLASSVGFVAYVLWDRRRRKPLTAKAAEEVDMLEELWKDQKLEQAREAATILAWEKAYAGEVSKRLTAPSQDNLSILPPLQALTLGKKLTLQFEAAEGDEPGRKTAKSAKVSVRETRCMDTE